MICIIGFLIGYLIGFPVGLIIAGKLCERW